MLASNGLNLPLAKWLYMHSTGRDTIPQGWEVIHKCGNKFCININHIALGRPVDRIKAAVKAGKITGRPVLRSKDVLEMRALYETKEWTQRQLAEKFNVGQTTVGKIVRRETYDWT